MKQDSSPVKVVAVHVMDDIEPGHFVAFRHGIPVAFGTLDAVPSIPGGHDMLILHVDDAHSLSRYVKAKYGQGNNPADRKN